MIATLLVCGPVLATPVTVDYSTGLMWESTYRLVGTSSTSDLLHICSCDPQPILLLPFFDQSLGTLVSAHLTIDANMASEVLDHSQVYFPNTAYFKDSGVAHWSLTPFAIDSIIAVSGAPGFSLANVFQTYSQVEDEGKSTVLNVLNPVYISSDRSHSSTLTFDQEFTDAALQAFLQPGDFGFYDGGRGFDGEHTGLIGGHLADSYLADPTEVQPGTKPGIGDLIHEAARLVNDAANDSTDHDLDFSDLHVGLTSDLSMTVTYTYEPAALGDGGDSPVSVPEPATLPLVVMGLAWITRRKATSFGAFARRKSVSFGTRPDAGVA